MTGRSLPGAAGRRWRLVAAGHGLAALPLSLAAALPGTAGIRLSAPRLVHRTEVLHPRAPAAVAQEFITGLTG
ncbi:hypothetical protein ACGFN1_35190 [Streptomyces sp. NPDC048685]|uniref:hypothetical protein n=1 Tax=Streptomyces sp. NPDC048685 TaxID=3365584 RepID=UPI0037107DE5